MLAVIDRRAPKEIVDGLRQHGFTPLMLPPHPDLPSPVASHPDMLLFFAKDRILCTEQYARIAKQELETLSEHTKKPIVCVRDKVEKTYPRDILLNASTVGDALICNAAHTASEVFECVDATVCNVRQGYAKCSVVPIAPNALITSDPSIAKSAKKIGIDVLTVSAAPIEIPQYDCGFLGGATSFAPYTELASVYFCGNLRAHPDALEIERFCLQYKKTPISLAEIPLTDLGTVFLL